MKIEITRLKLENFKCFRNKVFTFNSDIVTILGRNGSGKTTIADAILFCLFGKNTEGQSDLELFKTRENGKVIPSLDHSVEISLSVRDLLHEGRDECASIVKSVTLRRSIKEVWVKKRGSDESVFKNNTVEYFIDGESFTKADYEKYINSIISESVFKAITNPNYFPSLKWQEQRAFLTKMVGTIEPESIADTDELKALVDYFDQHDEDIEAYLKHRSYQIKEIKKKLEKIPVRLEEQNKALPEKLDWNALEAELEDAKKAISDIETKISGISKGQGLDVRRKEINNLIASATKELGRLRIEAEDESNRLEAEKRNRVSRKLADFNNALNNQKILEQSIEADKRLIARCKETIAECEQEREKLIDQWPRRSFTFDDSMRVCPTCGQELPYDQIEERREKARQAFNIELEAEKKSINAKGQKNNEVKAKAEEELKSYEAKLSSDTNELATIKQSINDVFSEKAKLEKEPVPTSYDLLAQNEEYTKLQERVKQLKESLDASSDSDDNREELAELESEKKLREAELTNIHTQLATRQQYDKILALIDGINEEQKDLVRQLSILEREEDIARQYQSRQNQLLEGRLNQYFQLVQWRLFRTVNNGGDSFDEPFCECYVDGVPYHGGLNQAARLNAGLDICETLCKFYNVAAPIVIDNSESNLNIYSTTGQQIRLQVFDSELNLK